MFDRPEAPPTQVFVNPFACYNVSPLLWEELQRVGGWSAQPCLPVGEALGLAKADRGGLGGGGGGGGGPG